MTHASLPARDLLTACQKAYDEVVEELKTPSRADGMKHHNQDRRTAIIRLATAALKGENGEAATVIVTAEDFCLIHPHY